MGASDFRSSPPSFSLFRLVRRCALLPAPTIGSPWLPRTLVVRLDAVFDPGVAPRACQCARDAVACWSEETIGQHTNASISGLNYLQGQHYLCPLHLASFRAYASSSPLPECLQGSIPGPWLAVTWAGFTPARLRGIAKPRPSVASGWSSCRVGLAPTGKRRLVTAHAKSGLTASPLKPGVRRCSLSCCRDWHTPIALAKTLIVNRSHIDSSICQRPHAGIVKGHLLRFAFRSIVNRRAGDRGALKQLALGDACLSFTEGYLPAATGMAESTWS